MPAASILIKPASANCNMDCKYCFYKCLANNRAQYNMGFMSEETLEVLIKNAIQYADGFLSFAFQGGEPTLIGLDFYKKAVALQKKYAKVKPGLRIENTLQTNGIALNDEWCEFFQKENFLIGISLDGPRKVHDLARKFPDGRDSFETVMNAVSLLKKHNVEFNILTVITENLAVKASALYKFYRRNDFKYIQLIPCMGDNPYAVSAASYGKFLCEFFDLWYEDFKAGYIMDVRMFSNLAQMSVGYPAEECGMCGHCNCYFVVEGDGSVYPCDFYCTDNYHLGTVNTKFSELISSEIVKKFESESYEKPQKCLECKYYSYCRGGCRKLRESGLDGVNYLCEGYQLFFEHTSERIRRLGQTIVNPGARALL